VVAYACIGAAAAAAGQETANLSQAAQLVHVSCWLDFLLLQLLLLLLVVVVVLLLLVVLVSHLPLMSAGPIAES
jgi:hypothetical protein